MMSLLKEDDFDALRILDVCAREEIRLLQGRYEGEEKE